MSEENKRKYAHWLRPDTIKLAEEMYPRDNCSSRSEYIEKAVHFYRRWLTSMTKPSASCGSTKPARYKEAKGFDISPGAGTLNCIKLEIGEKATPFVPRHIAEELAMCQWMCFKLKSHAAVFYLLFNFHPIINKNIDFLPIF